MVCDIEDDKEYGIAVNKVVPSYFRGYMFAIKKGYEYNLLRNRAGKFVKQSDIEDFLNQYGDA